MKSDFFLMFKERFDLIIDSKSEIIIWIGK